MAELYFKVQADVDKIIQLRTEIENLKSSLSGMNRNIDPSGVAALESRLQSAQSQMNGMVSSAAKAGESLKGQFADAIIGAKGSLDSLLGTVGKFSALSLGGIGLGSIISQVVNVRGQFEDLEVSFKTLLGSGDKANTLMNQLVQTAAKTPFDLQGVAAAANQLLAYGEDVQNVNGDIVRLGNIASGLGLSMNDMAYLYGTTMVQGRLYARDLLQFTSRGIPMTQELAKQFGVSTAEVSKLVSAGKVGFPQVKRAIENMTNSGGKFYNLMEEKSKTVNGRISNIGDQISTTLNDIGKSSDGVINGALSGIEFLLDNLQTLGRLVASSVAVIGTYKTALIIVNALQKQAAVTAAMEAAGITGVTVAERIHYGLLVIQTAAQKALNAAMAINPYVALATAVAAVGAALYMCTDRLSTTEEAQNSVNKSIEDAQKAQEKYNSETEDAIRLASSEASSSLDRKKGMDVLIARYPSIIKKYIDEEGHLRDIVGLKREIAELDGKKTVKQTIGNANKDAKYAKMATSRNDVLFSKAKQQYLKETGQIGSFKSPQEIADYFNKKSKQERYNAGRSLTGNKVQKNIDSIGKTSLGTARKRASYYAKLLGKYKGKHISVKDPYTGDAITSADMEKLYVSWSGAAASKGKSSTRDKEYYTNKKKEIQAKLDKMSHSDATGAKGASLKKQLNKLDKVIGGYDATDNNKSTSKAKSSGDKRREAGIAAEKKRQAAYKQLAETSLEFIQKNQDDETDLMSDGTEKKLQKIDDDYNKRKAEIIKQEAKFKDLNKKAGVNTLNSGLTTNQTNQLKIATDNNTERRKKAEKEVYADKLKNLYDYLKEFGTVQEQMYAIEKEYDDKIAEEKDPNKKKSLQMEEKDKLSSANAQNLAMNIDWSKSFSGIGNVLQDIAKETLDKVNEYMKTDEFKKLPADQKKSYTDLRENLNTETGGNSTSAFNFKIWGQIADETKKYQNSVRILQEKTKAHTDAVENLKAAEKKLASATDESSKKIAQAGVDAARGKVGTTGAEQTEAQGQVQTAQGDLTNSTEKAKNGLDNFSNAISTMSNGSLQGFGDGISMLVTSLSKGSNGVGKKLNELGGKIGGLIGAILAILDSLGDDPQKFFDDLLNRIGSAIEGLISQLPQIIITILKDVVNIVGGIFSGIGSWFTGGGNTAKVNRETDKLTKSNEYLKDSIDSLSDTISKQGGTKAVTAGAEAISDQEKVNANNQEKLKLQMQYTGTHHSNAYYWGKKNGSDEMQSYYTAINSTLAKYAKENNTTQKTVSSMDSFLNLTPEEMDAIRTHNADVWASLLDIGKYDKSKYFDEYADLAGEKQKIQDAVNEALTGTTKSDMKDSFESDLLDMSKDADDFKTSFTKKLQESVINAKISDLMDSDIDAFYKDWAARAAKAGGLTTDDTKALSKEWATITQKGLTIRDEAAAITGYTGTDEQSATTGSIENITQDQAEQLIGRITATQIAAEQANIKHDLLNATASDILVLSKSQINIVDGIQTLMANSYIELKGINANTGASAKHLATIDTNMANMYKCIKDKL